MSKGPISWESKAKERYGVIRYVLCGRTVRYEYQRSDQPRGFRVWRHVTGTAQYNTFISTGPKDLEEAMAADLEMLEGQLALEPYWSAQRFQDYYDRLIRSGMSPYLAGLEVQEARERYEGRTDTCPPLLYELVREVERNKGIFISNESCLFDWGITLQDVDALSVFCEKHDLKGIRFYDPQSGSILFANQDLPYEVFRMVTGKRPVPEPVTALKPVADRSLQAS